MKDRTTEFDPARLEADLLEEEMEVERWLPLPGWERIYDVSDMGRVRSYWSRNGRAVMKRHRIMAVRIASQGYIKVRLYRPGGNNAEHWVHRMVALAFLGEPAEGDLVHHRDTCRTNNRLSNLKWATPTENNQYKNLGQKLREEEATA